MGELLQSVYADVLDYGASTESTTDPALNFACLQLAINSGKHVLFPAGIYRFRGVLQFDNDDQKCLFLAGAILQPTNEHSYVLVTGERQTFVGMKVVTLNATPLHSPIIEVFSANGTTFEELRVSILTWTLPDAPANPILRAAVRVQGLTGCTFIGGRISGPGTTGTVGLWITDYPLPDGVPGALGDGRGARVASLSAIGLRVAKFAWAVRADCNASDVSFIECAFARNIKGSLLLTNYDSGESHPVMNSLRVINCRMGGADPEHYIKVAADCSWKGGLITGCVFDRGDDSSEESDPVDEGATGVSGTRDVPSAPPDTPITKPDTEAPKQTQAPVTPSPVSTAAGAGLAGTSLTKAKLVRTVVPAPANPGSRKINPLHTTAVARDTAPAVVPAPSNAWQAGKTAPARVASGRASSSGSTKRQASSEEDPWSEVPLGKPTGVRRDPTPGTEAQLPCIVNVGGTIDGVLVSGCSSFDAELRTAVWWIAEAAELTQTADLFNDWAQDTIASGAGAGQLIWLAAGDDGEVTIVAEQVSFDSEFMLLAGDGSPTSTTLAGPYSVPTGSSFGDHDLGFGNAHLVLGQLLHELAKLGLIVVS